MTDVTSLGRFRLVGVGELTHPGECFVCRSGTRQEGYVNLDVYFDFEGQMYICNYCLNEVGAVMGMLNSEESEFLKNHAAVLAKELDEVKEKLRNAEHRLSSYDDVLRPLAVSISSATELASSSDAPKQSADKSASGGASDNAPSGAAGRKPAPKKSVASAGRSDAGGSEPSNGLEL